MRLIPPRDAGNHRPAPRYTGFAEAQLPLAAPPAARAPVPVPPADPDHPLGAAVAQVLAYVYQLRAALNGQGAMPPAELPALDVPSELDPHHRPAP